MAMHKNDLNHVINAASSMYLSDLTAIWQEAARNVSPGGPGGSAPATVR